ncbi:TetR-like C-terminal domain-containing protein [Bacillus sp. CGMCC 1.16607]|uniref:TetR/AcrR family transcriptional regulator n=1 Tax=Bacillus sp. CGMCC 1.16607 TaxID=3351842 RepID=UPI003628E9D2
MSIKNDYMDRRIVKSKMAMRDAMISLMHEKDIREISISNIVRLADLNRGTFYKHYQYTEDILNEIIDEVMTDLIESFREPYKNKEVLEVNKLNTSVIKIFDHVIKYSKFYSLIVQTNTLAGFQHKFCHVLIELALHDLNDSLPDPKINRELHASYQAYAILGLMIEWINGGFKYSSSYMAEQLLEFLKHNQSNSVFRPRI